MFFYSTLVNDMSVQKFVSYWTKEQIRSLQLNLSLSLILRYTVDKRVKAIILQLISKLAKVDLSALLFLEERVQN